MKDGSRPALPGLPLKGSAGAVVVGPGGKGRALFVGFFSMFAFLFSMQAVPPLLPLLMEEFSLSYTGASSLMWLVALPGLFLSILGGVLTGRYGVKPLSVTGALIVTLASALSAFSWSLPLLQVSRLLLGVGGALVVVSAPALIFQWFDRRELGAAMGVFGLNMPLATVLSFNLLGGSALHYGWRTSLGVTIGVNLAALTACWGLTRERGVSRRGLGEAGFRPLGNPAIWVLGGVWALFNMAAIGYTTWGKTIFIRYEGLSPPLSDLLASLLMVGAFTTPLTGLLSDRLERRKLLLIASSASMGAALLILPHLGEGVLIPSALALGVLAAFLPPALFALPEEVLGRGRGAVGLGVLNTFLNLGVILGPLLVGYVLDLTDSKVLAFLSMAVFAFSASLLASRLRAR